MLFELAMAALIQANLKPDHRAFQRYEISETLEVEQKITKVEITHGESEVQKREREEREKREREEQEREQQAKLARESHSKASSPRVEVLYPDGTNNCVSFAKRQTGINRPLGTGGRSAIQGQEPRVGAIGSTKGTPHAVVVTVINGNYITVIESNYKKNFITRRVLARSEFIGFIYR